MPRVLLLHSQKDYASSLTRELRSANSGWVPTDISGKQVSDRLKEAIGSHDVIQVDETVGNGMLGAFASVFQRSPLVLSIRGWADYTNAHGEYGPLKMATIRARTKAVLQLADHVVFISETVREEFCKEYDVGDSTVIGRPIDAERYREGNGLQWSGRNVLTVTNLRYEGKYRGVIHVLRALEPLFEEYPELRYRVAGSGRYLSNLQEFLDTYPHADRVDLLGYREDIEDIYSSADVYVYVSFLDSLSTTILEAQAAGLPVIGGDAVGIPEAVGDGGVVASTEPPELREAIDRVLRDAEHRQELEQRSHQRILTYNRESALAHARVWDEVIGRTE